MLPQDSQFVEHFYGLLIPWYEYVPTSTWALAAAVRFLREHDALARHIALNALRFAKRNLLLRPTLCYILLIWRRIAALQEGLDWDMIEADYGLRLEEVGFKPLKPGTDLGRTPFITHEEWLQLKPEGQF